MSVAGLTGKRRSEDSVNELLGKFGLKKTRTRQIILNHFLKCKKPQSQSEILKKLLVDDVEMDSVTLYRTLLKFVGIGLIHKIPDNRYLLCSHLCRRKSHIVLNCESCERIWEIADSRSLIVLGGMLADHCVLSQTQPIFLNCLCKVCKNETQYGHEVVKNG